MPPRSIRSFKDGRPSGSFDLFESDISRIKPSIACSGVNAHERSLAPVQEPLNVFRKGGGSGKQPLERRVATIEFRSLAIR